MEPSPLGSVSSWLLCSCECWEPCGWGAARQTDQDLSHLHLVFPEPLPLKSVNLNSPKTQEDCLWWSILGGEEWCSQSQVPPASPGVPCEAQQLSFSLEGGTRVGAGPLPHWFVLVGCSHQGPGRSQKARGEGLFQARGAVAGLALLQRQFLLGGALLRPPPLQGSPRADPWPPRLRLLPFSSPHTSGLISSSHLL